VETKIRIYFDSCAIQRPLDHADHLRILLEVEALIGIFALVDSGTIELVSSEALELEIARIPTPLRREYATNLLGQAVNSVLVTEQIEQRARLLVSQQIRSMDALHLACAEATTVNYFCTCDDRLLKRAKNISDLQIAVVSPLELIAELEL
jgi:predicted nucleic acid-binding protein